MKTTAVSNASKTGGSPLAGGSRPASRAASPASGNSGFEGTRLVTRTFSPIFGNSHDLYTDLVEPFFVDWLSMKQTFDVELPLINAGVVLATDVNGDMQWQTTRASVVRGSHETSVQVRCDGHTVIFSGNVSRFGRTNNLFGYDLAECIRRVNDILMHLGLPPFTRGQRHVVLVNTGKGLDERVKYTGAEITRIDLTANYETGSLSNARAYMEWLSGQQATRLKVGTHGDGETVDWGRGSKRIYSKVYLKSAELRRHAKNLESVSQIIDHCESVGLIRFEITVKARRLSEINCHYLGGLDMGRLIELFNEKRAVLVRAEHSVDDLADLPNNYRRTARDYLAGDDLVKTMSRTTFYKHRSAILPYGIDIAVKRNVINFLPRVRVIEVRAASAPCWYDFEILKAA